MAITPQLLDELTFDREREKTMLIAEREMWLADWQKRALPVFQPTWDVWPTISLSTGTAWNRLVSPNANYAYMDRFLAYIYGEKDGLRYYRALEATGGEREEGAADLRLLQILQEVTQRGPSVCTAIEDGGILPLESEQVPL